MSVRAVTPYVERHGLVMAPYRDLDHYDLMRDDALTPTIWDADAPEVSVNLSKRRGAQTPPRPAPATSPPAGAAPDHDAADGGFLSPPLAARGLTSRTEGDA